MAAIRGLRPSPFGLSECCICDEPATVGVATETAEVLPYCDAHVPADHADFPTDSIDGWRERFA